MHNRREVRAVLGWLVLILLLPVPVVGQVEREVQDAAARTPGQPNGSRYRLRLDQPEKLLVFSVHIWGEVRQPGLFSVPEGTTVIDLISLAGGPTSSAKLNSVKLVRANTTGPQQVTMVDLKSYLSSGGSDAWTVLLPDDTLMIESKSSANLLKWTGFVSVIALVANVVVNATN